jgi:dihydrofolate reductase
MEQLDDYDAFVMGRVTYERLSANWAHLVGNPYIDRINAMPKYVASRALRDPGWNATVLGPDAAGAIARLKQQAGKDLIKYGTSRLDNLLLRECLVDELHLWYMPVVVGAGQRLFEDVDTSSLDLRLTDTLRLGNGSVMLSYAVG